MSIWNSLSSLGSAVIGAITGNSAANKQVQAGREANEANLRIAQMNNEYNAMMFEKQNRWNLEQWMRENEYNSAAQQAARFREAGINPYLAMTSGASAGSASSVSSAPAMPADESGTQQPVDYSLASRFAENLHQGLQQAVQVDLNQSLQRAQIRKMNEESNNLFLEGKYLNQSLIARVAQMIESSDLPRYQKRMMQSMIDKQFEETGSIQRQNELFDVTYNDHANELRVRNQVAASQAANNWLDARIKRKQLPYVVPQIQAQITELGAKAAAGYASAGLSDAQAKNALADYLFKTFGGSAPKWSSKVWNSLADYMMRQQHTTTYKLEQEYTKGWLPSFNGFGFGFKW